MKVLLASFKNEYGKPEWGPATIEYQNFFGTLEKMSGVEASFFAVDEVMAKVGREEMNQQLINIVEDQKPDLLFTVIFQDEIKKETIEHITKNTSTKTFNWFTDDHWRLPVYSKFWAPLFTAVGTTDSKAPEKYKALGINNVIKTQWGVNQNLYRKVGVSEDRSVGSEVSFVGKNYGSRSKYIRSLKKAGLSAEGYGKGWESGTVGFDRMLEIFSNSKINLNFTESPYVTFSAKIKLLIKMFMTKERGSFKMSFDPLGGLESAAGAQRRQIKGRTFEVPACGGFLISGNADNLGDYYIDGKEIVIFKNQDELLEKCQYYLEHEEERKAIASAGYDRTLREHTYEKRFTDIFKAMGLM